MEWADIVAHLLDDTDRPVERSLVARLGDIGRLGAPRDPKQMHRVRRRSRIQQVEVRGDHLLQGNDARTLRKRNPARAIVGHLDAHEALPFLVAEEHRQIQSQIGLQNSNPCSLFTQIL